MFAFALGRALLRCLKQVEVQGKPLLGTSVSDFKFTPKEGECNKKNAKYYACGQ